MDVYNDTMKTDFDFADINFNTFLNSLITFYVVILNDNWVAIANVSVINSSSSKRQIKFIFVLYKLLVNYILINSLIAFIIEIFYEYEKTQLYRPPVITVKKESERLVESEEILDEQDTEYDELSNVLDEQLMDRLDESFD